jgi:YHS domain-containing protein
MRKDVDKELGNNLLKTEIMAKLSTRESHLRRVENKKKALKKGKEYYFSNKKSSSKFRKILENNCLIIKQLSRESQNRFLLL